MDAVALVIALIGALGVGSSIQHLVERRWTRNEAAAEREHVSKEARAVRLWGFRLDVYRGAATHLSTLEQIAIRTDPLIGPTLDVPEIKADEAWIKQGAEISIGCSSPVRAGMQKAIEAFVAFQQAAIVWRMAHDGKLPATAPGEPTAREKMEDARTEAVTAIKAAQTVMRDELESM